MTAQALESAAFVLPDFGDLDLVRPYSILDRLHSSSVKQASPQHQANPLDLCDRFATTCSLRNTFATPPRSLHDSENSKRPDEWPDLAGPSNVTIEDLDSLEEDEDGGALRSHRRLAPLTWDSWQNVDDDQGKYQSNQRISDFDTIAGARVSGLGEALLASFSGRLEEEQASKCAEIVTIYSAEEALSSLLQTASGFASALFAWDFSSKRYVPARSSQVRRTTKRKSIGQIDSKDRFLQDEREELASLMAEAPEDCVVSDSTFRISGLSQAATQSLCQRFLNIGSLLRRIEEVLDAGRRSAYSSIEQSALYRALETVTDWLSDQLGSWRAVNRGSSVLQAHGTLSAISDIVADLANLLECEIKCSRGDGRMPGKHTSLHLDPMSKVYTHLEAATERGDGILIGIHLFLLDATSHSWRRELTSWIGWPSHTSITGSVHDGLARRIDKTREGSALTSERRRGKFQNRFSPLVGLEVEWSWDHRDELDVGYVIRPRHLPRFMPLRYARDILEGGRAIQLLSQIVDREHPALSVGRHNPSKFLTPSWSSSLTGEWRESWARVNAEIRRVREESQDWTRVPRSQAMSGASSTNPIFDRQSLDTYRTSAGRDGDALSVALETYDMLPSSVAQEQSISGHSREQLERCIDTALVRVTDCSSRNSPAGVTKRCIIDPAVLWARTMSASLIYVYVHDLRFMRYLDMCKAFFFMGHEPFRERVANVLFVETESEGNHIANELAPVASGDGLSELLKSSTMWPPSSHLVAPALNRALQESLMDWMDGNTSTQTSSKITEGRISVEAEIQDRLSFLLFGDSGGVEYQPHDIATMDWLSLAFHPPSIISPLMTPDAMQGYEQVFAFLARLKRVEVVCKSMFQQLIASGTKQHRGCLYEGDPDHTLLLRLRYELSHFIQALVRYTYFDIIEKIWREFYSRLEGSFGKLSSDDSLQDVFSIATFHEATLDEIREGLYLKSHQRETAALLATVMNATLALGGLVHASRTNDVFGTDDRVALGRVHASFQRARQKLLRALRMPPRQKSVRGNSDPAPYREAADGFKGHFDTAQQDNLELESDAPRYGNLFEEARNDLAQAL